jgi:ABC-type sugar transport system ATPase subunit
LEIDKTLKIEGKINKKDIIAIVGPVCCGKSLILQCFAGLVD